MSTKIFFFGLTYYPFNKLKTIDYSYCFCNGRVLESLSHQESFIFFYIYFSTSAALLGCVVKLQRNGNTFVEVGLAVIQLTSAGRETGADCGLPHIYTPTPTDDTLQHLIKALKSHPFTHTQCQLCLAESKALTCTS